jgi:hypothetical protein
MEINVSEQQINLVIDRLDQIKLELLRLRALLLPEEALSPGELRELDEARVEVEQGRCRPLDDVLRSTSFRFA